MHMVCWGKGVQGWMHAVVSGNAKAMDALLPQDRGLLTGDAGVPQPSAERMAYTSSASLPASQPQTRHRRPCWSTATSGSK